MPSTQNRNPGAGQAVHAPLIPFPHSGRHSPRQPLDRRRVVRHLPACDDRAPGFERNNSCTSCRCRRDNDRFYRASRSHSLIFMAMQFPGGIFLMMLSIVVNFFNNPREARNSLYSMTRAYQMGASDFPYEVIVIDHGSPHPLDADEVQNYGREFKYRSVPTTAVCPARAINDACRD